MADEDLNPGGDAGTGAATPDTGLSLRDELAAALSAQTGEGSDGAVAQGAQQAPVAAKPAAQGQQAPAAQGAQPRTETGQFAKKGEQGQNLPNSETGQSGASAEPPPQATIGPPPSWSAAAKAAYPTLPEAIRNEIAKREGDIERGKAQWQQGAERLNRLDAILAPRRERFQLAGIDETQAVRALFAAQDLLERDPVNALLYLARQSGVGPQHLMQALGMSQQQQPQTHPQIQALAQQVQALTNAQAQQQSSAVQARKTEFLNQVNAFAADPKNVYFENVRDRMAALIQAGVATDIPDAYEKACWADPEIRPLMLSQQAQQGQANTQAAARAKAEQARRASGSVIGSPTPGATPAGGSVGNVRDDLQAAWNALA